MPQWWTLSLIPFLEAVQEKKKKYEPPIPPPRVGKKQRKKGAGATLGSKLPTVVPTSKCRLRLLKLERVKDWLLLEEEYVTNQERLAPLEERNEENRSKVGSAQAGGGRCPRPRVARVPGAAWGRGARGGPRRSCPLTPAPSPRCDTDKNRRWTTCGDRRWRSARWRSSSMRSALAEGTWCRAWALGLAGLAGVGGWPVEGGARGPGIDSPHPPRASPAATASCPAPRARSTMSTSCRLWTRRSWSQAAPCCCTTRCLGSRRVLEVAPPGRLQALLPGGARPTAAPRSCWPWVVGEGLLPPERCPLGEGPGSPPRAWPGSCLPCLGSCHAHHPPPPPCLDALVRACTWWAC